MRKSLIILCSMFLSFLTLTNVNYAQESNTEYLCIIDDAGNKVQVAQFTTTVLPSGDVHAEFITSLAVNDNSYGLKDGPDNSVQWGDKTHKFSDLLGSDKAIFEIYGENGDLVMDFDLDYIGIDPSALSGYASHGIDENGEKSDGELRSGQASWLLDYNTSLTRNLNELGYSAYTDLSPETINSDSYTVVNSADEDWIFEMIYEVTISKDAFGQGGFIGQSSIIVPNLHNSPSKLKIEDPFNCDPPVCDGLIGDFIWEDQNCDGIQDSGEPGISGITVYLKDGGGNIIGTATTDLNGFYSFEVDDLCDNIEECAECDGKVTNLTLKYNGSVNDAQIKVKQKNGDIVFNGVVQPGEEFSFSGTDNGTLGTEIEIFVNNNSVIKIHTSCSQDIFIGSVFGDFLVTAGASLNGGPLCDINGGSAVEKCYTVEVDVTTVPPGYSPSPIGAGPSDTDSNPNPSLVCLTSENNEDLTIDFGYCPPEVCLNTIGDFVWHDINTDGIQNPNEPGIDGIVVELFNGGSSPIATAVTGPNGYYEFANLADGVYQVRVPVSNFGAGKPLDSSAPNMEWNASPKNKGGDDTADSDANKGEKVTVVLNCNDDYTIDFGFFKSCVTVEKTGPAGPVKPGDVVNYTLTVYNCGDSKLNGGVTITDELLGYSNNVDLEAGETFTVTIPYTVTDLYCESGVLINCVEVIGHPIDKYGTGYPNVIDEDCWSVVINCEDDCSGEIGDYVFVDNSGDCDGTQTGSTPIAGATVQITYTENSQVVTRTATTNGNGYYLFAGLCANNYSVQVISLPPQYSNYTISSGTSNPHLVVLTTDIQKYYGADFGYCPPEDCSGEIGDYVFVDNIGDCDGNQTGSTPIAGATVQITYTENSQVVTKTATTNANGYYLFAGLCANNYSVQVISLPPQYSNYTISSGTSNPHSVVLTTDDQKYYDADFGYCPPEDCSGEIGDYVFVDNSGDCNGDQTGSTPIAGATVQLTYTENSQLITRTATTDGNGYYLFTELCANNYSVQVISLPPQYSGYTISGGSSNPHSVVLTTDDQKYYDADFGYCPPCVGDGKIGNRVWFDHRDGDYDTNCDGLQQDGEPGIEGVRVILKNASGAMIAQETTDADGMYLFEDLCTDNICYLVFIDASTLPPGYTPTSANVGTDIAIDSDDSGVEVCLTESHQVDLTIDFGFCPSDCEGCEYSCIGDFVWDDINQDGIQDINEPGVEDVTVELYSEAGIKVSTTVTNSAGNYLFTDLIPGKYYVKFILPAGKAFTLKDQGSDDELDSDAGANGRTALTLLYPGICDLSWDAGLIPAPAAPSCIGDRVWFDSNYNGLQDLGEPGIGNVTVKLWSGSTLIGTAITDNFGDYKFNNLPAGNYKLTFVLPAGYLFTLQNVGSDENIDSDANPGDGKTVQFYLNEGECQLHWDAGMYANLPDLRLEKVVDNPNPDVGDPITFTITVCNDGPADATGVEVTDYVLTEGVSYQNYSSSQGTYNSGTGIWEVGALLNGQCATLELNYIVEEWTGDIEYEDFDLGIAGDYNVFALCSVNFPSSDTECKMAVGWDAYLSNYSVGDKLPPSGGSEDALVVGRSLTFTSGAVYGGNAVYGTTTNLPIPGVSINDGDLIQDPNRIDFHAAAMYLKNLASNLAGYAVNGTTDFQWGSLTLTGTDPRLNVFHVSGVDLTNAHTTTINVPNGSVVLVNIDGDNITWSGGLSVNGTAINNVLYNFYQATYLTIQYIDIRGSILAPCALVDFVSGVQNGQMIAKYITGRGQYNCEMFLGHIPTRPHIINVAEITHVDQDDPDSTPGNGVPSEDDYATATIYFSETYNGSGGNSGNGDWEPIGNLSIGETVWTITADLNGNLLAGTAGGKLYISYDGGVSWTHINASMTVGFIWSIAVTNSGGILLGTEQGMFFSTNLGVTWTGPLGGLYFDFRSVAIDNATNTFYAASWGLGVYKSTDFGTTWLPVNLGLGSLIVNSLVIDSQSRIYAGTFSNGVYVSTTAGASWVNTNIQFNFTWAMAVTSNDHIYAATYGGGVFVSINNGTSWDQINSGLEAEFVYAIAVNANDDVYVSTWTGGIFKFGSNMPKSVNNGNTVTSGSWEPVGMSGTGISALMVDRNASAVYAGGENGAIYMKKENDVTTDVQIGGTLPEDFSLSQNFPNPFNPSTTIKFSIPVNGNYQLKIYNIIGEQVAQLINGVMDPGYHEVQFDASHLTSGIYLYSLVGNNVNITRKMILMK